MLFTLNYYIILYKVYYLFYAKIKYSIIKKNMYRLIIAIKLQSQVDFTQISFIGLFFIGVLQYYRILYEFCSRLIRNT